MNSIAFSLGFIQVHWYGIFVAAATAIIFSAEVQDFMAKQGFIPAVSGEVPEVLNHDNLQLIWNGWDGFLRAVAQVAEA